ncbi:hypothetical protein N9N67_01035 [Bacteriovoracaceae bacterium]|nr:hypothetical protein [Bacteriovoracaceae bacterium]
MIKYLNQRQIKTIIKLGDLYLPGNQSFSKFSERNQIHHIDRVLKFINKDDLNDLGLFLQLLSFLPTFVLSIIIASASKHNLLFAPLASPFRLLHISLKGLACTLYYSKMNENDGQVLDQLNWNPKMNPAVKDEEMKKLIEDNDFNKIQY